MTGTPTAARRCSLPVRPASARARAATRRLVSLALCLLVAGALPACSPAQRTFQSPTDAANTLVQAMRDDDRAELKSIFGPGASALLSSGDDVIDRRQREVFVAAAEQQWSLLDLDGGAKELVIGHEDWPFPVPLVPDAGGWRFDTEAGKQEVLARRIGRDEIAAIAMCRTYVTAQREYASQGHDGQPAGAFAQRFQSQPGSQDGLYWPTAPGERASPLGALAARAASEGYDESKGKAGRPFHGYFFRILHAQGPHAAGGARDYISNGRMTGGFALIAYPATYRNSGVMTFMVNQDGVVHEADLGPDTATVAAGMTRFDPGPAWRLVD